MTRGHSNRINATRRPQYGILTRLSSSWNSPPPPHNTMSLRAAATQSLGNPRKPRDTTCTPSWRSKRFRSQETIVSATSRCLFRSSRHTHWRIARSPRFPSASPPRIRNLGLRLTPLRHLLQATCFGLSCTTPPRAKKLKLSPLARMLLMILSRSVLVPILAVGWPPTPLPPAARPIPADQRLVSSLI